MQVLYSFGIWLYGFFVRIAALFNPKAKKWARGQKTVFDQIEAFKLQKTGGYLAWFHCASLGEFEQGRPVIEKFKQQNPDYRIVLTFWSPSGYEIRKSYAEVNAVFYLPQDTKHNVRQFLDLLKPQMVFFVKYEFWFNYLQEIQKRQIPLYIFSAIFRPDQHFFKGYGSWSRNILKRFDHIFVQNQASQQLLQSVGIENVLVAGDTRFDRVAQVTHAAKKFPELEPFFDGKPVIVAGSTWEPDEQLLVEYFLEKDNTFKWIVAPHEIGKNHIEKLKTGFGKKAVLYSEIKNSNINQFDVIIVDCIGILMHLYQYGSLAYIGGGFGVGIHNILEAATFGLPVVFGPNYQKFNEAVELINQKGAFSVQNFEELKTIFDRLLSDQLLLQQTSGICKNYVESRTGATDLILGNLK